MPRVDSRRPRIVYILGRFPSISETFVLREMVALESMGFHLTPLSLMPALPTPVHAEAEPFIPRTIYRCRLWSRMMCGAVLKTVFQRPLGLAGALWLLVRYSVLHPGAARQLLSSFGTAIYFASRLAPREIPHAHAHFASMPATVGLFLVELCGCGFSISCHANDIFGPGTVVLPRKLREADFVAVCTRYGMERLQRNHSLILADKLHLVRHGIESGRMTAGQHVDYPLPMILSVGRLVEKKGLPFLLQAAAILNGQGMQFELVIVGDGPMRDELERLAGGLGLRDKVVFAGYLTQEQLVHVYRRADVFCQPSIVGHDGDRDGLPNVILEAMAYGVPVVASNLSAIPEAVIDGETGLLAAPGAPQELAAQLERVLSDPELRERLVANARRRIEDEFDTMKNTVRLGGLFAQALGLKEWPLPDTAGQGARERVEM